ncbi:mechanosensitive ion channel family protein [Hyphomonas sp.]|jgi:small-conductance mechanosensitive channel|uniref:mechanosensitive ion channel family protein n=1 Tax=Hyphomonas sp. TaxID=87 RepID=UPI0032D9145F
MPASPHSLLNFVAVILRAVILTLVASTSATSAMSQSREASPSAPSSVIAATPPATSSDDQIEDRIQTIFTEVDELNGISASVRNGVVTLGGATANAAAAERAEQIALRIEGVVTIQNQIKQAVGVEDNVSPILETTSIRVNQIIRSMPLLAVALTVFLVISFLGHLLASWRGFWRRIMPNSFLSDLVAGASRIIAVVVGLIVAMNVMGATTLLGTVLGGAGVIGLALGFAVRDTLENYISSIMLSIRQPFRANEHVVIDEHEGIVVRLTSRSTVLMTLNGNHLRIPNSTVFKAVILNYTRNPERRFEFDLGVDANDDPVAAMQLGLDTLKSLPYVLEQPDPESYIQTVGDSNIVLRFMGWVDQRNSNFGKARGLAISATKDVLEQEGFTLPEPIYRLRFDTGTAQPAATGTGNADAAPSQPKKQKDIVKPREAADVRPDSHLNQIVAEERAATGEEDLLDEKRPVE